MRAQTPMPHRTQTTRALALVVMALLASALAAETPKLNIRTKNRLPAEEQRKQQMERLAGQYDLSKYTITRDIIIERGAMNHSYPVLTLNLRFLDNDDLALSAYLHEQGHWFLMERHRPGKGTNSPSFWSRRGRRSNWCEAWSPCCCRGKAARTDRN